MGRTSRQRVLVVLFDGIGHRAAVAEITLDGCDVSSVVESRTADLRAALAELTAQFAAAGVRVPRLAVLGTVDATLAVVDLPAASSRLPLQELEALLRFEAEPYVQRVRTRRSLAAMLVASGELDAVSASDLVARSADDLAFADAALASGDVDRAALASARDQQASAGAPSGAVAVAALAVGESSTTGGSRQVIAAMPASVRDDAAAAFREQSLRLRAVVPLLGVVAAAVDPDMREQVVIDVSDGLSATVLLRDGAIARVAERAHRDAVPTLAEMRDAVGSASAPVVVFGDAALERLTVELQRERTGPVVLRTESVHGARLSAIAAAAMSAPARARIPVLPAADRRAPIWRSAGAAFAAAALVVIAFATATEVWRHRTTAEVDGVVELLDRVQGLQSRTQTLDAQLAELRGRRAFLQTRLEPRNEQVADLLASVAASVTESVVIDRVIEDAPGSIGISGWSLDEPAAQRFRESVSERVAPLSLEPGGLSVRARSGRLGLDGYTFSFRLVPGMGTRP